MMSAECDRVIKFIVYESTNKLTFVKVFLTCAIVGATEMIKTAGLALSKSVLDGIYALLTKVKILHEHPECFKGGLVSSLWLFQLRRGFQACADYPDIQSGRYDALMPDCRCIQ